MENKYEVTNMEKIGKHIRLYTLKDIKTNKEYSCLTEKQTNGKIQILSDDSANIFDVSEALFQNDLDIFPLLPLALVTPNIAREYENYHPGKGYCLFKTEKDYNDTYKVEENRVKEINQKIKKLVR